MKRIIAFILVLCMTFGTVISVSAADPFVKRLGLVRLIRAMFAQGDSDYGIGEYNDGVLTVYVATNGKADADGSEKKPYATVEAARDAIRQIDNTGLDGIDVVIGAGIYYITETIEFTADDSGSENCPIRYIGEEGAIINGGVAFDYTEFEKASGDTLSLFPEEVRDKLYMLDLAKFGYTPDDITEVLTRKKYYNYAQMINVNGEQMTIARYTNEDEGWIEIEGGYFLDADGNYTEENADSPKELRPSQTVIEYGEEHMERVLSWANRDELFVRGHYRFMWSRDDTAVTELYEDRDEMLLPYSGGWNPIPNGIVFFYNIPEELDAPGEFYIDRNAILYYYPEDNFETAHFTTPLLEGDILSITDAEYLTFENIVFETTLSNGVTATADNLTFDGCTFRDIYKKGLVVTGDNFTFVGNEVGYIGEKGIILKGGDKNSLTRANNIICNNYFHHWCTRYTNGAAIEFNGCGITVCHNEVGDSTDLGIGGIGPYNTIEYNYVHDTCRFMCDGATVGFNGTSHYGSVIRYNVVSNVGYDCKIDLVGTMGITTDMNSRGVEIYGNIVYNVTGSGITLAYGRDSVIRNNLIIKAGRFVLGGICTDYANDFIAGVPTTRKVAAVLLSETWQEAFPQIVGMHGNFDPENPYDPMYVMAPANNIVKDNYAFFDRAYRTMRTQGSTYKIDNILDFESFYYDFCEIEEPSVQNGTLTYYNSKRNKNPITIGEALDVANEAVGTVMTPEQLEEVGRIGVDHGIAGILVE